MKIPADEISKAEEESEDATSRAKEKHGGVTSQHGDEKMEIGREAKGDIGEKSAGGGGEKVFGERMREEAREEADGNSGNET